MELARNSFSSFKLELKGAGHFGSLEPHAIWLGVGESEPLRKLLKMRLGEPASSWKKEIINHMLP